MEGKDKHKYEKIYYKKGIMTKKGGYVGRYGENKILDKKWDRYGHKCEGRPYVMEVMNLDPKSMVDIGAGYNEFIKDIRTRTKYDKSKFIGVDIACPESDVIASAHNLPFDDEQYDMVVSFDCMEHIPEDEVPLAFKEFHRVGKRIYLMIALAHSPTRIDGEVLHVCIKSPEWWLQAAQQNFPKSKIRHHNRKGTPWEYIIIYGEK